MLGMFCMFFCCNKQLDKDIINVVHALAVVIPVTIYFVDVAMLFLPKLAIIVVIIFMKWNQNMNHGENAQAHLKKFQVMHIDLMLILLIHWKNI